MKKRLAVLMFGAVAVIGASAFAPPAGAQGRGGIAFASAGRGGAVVLRGGAGIGSGRMHRSRRSFAGYGFAPYFYSDSEPETIEGPGPVVVTRSVAEPSAPVAKPAESILLERHGDQWVRITNYGASSGAAEQGVATVAAPELPKAVLVFRDGHSEEVRKYVIAGTTLYTAGDYWSTGSWTRKVAIADLDVPATLKRNEERGTKFSLPSRSSEIMMRP